MKIPHFRGVYMRDNLPNSKTWKNECMIINHDSAKNHGTHWTCYVKDKENVFYYYKQYREFETIICGHLCLGFLYEYYKNEKIKSSI